MIKADARLWRSAERFDLCIIALNTFLHNLSRADQLATLRTAHDHLKPGGVLVIDLPPNDELAHQPDDGEYEFETKMIDPQAKTELEKSVASHVFWASQDRAELSHHRIITTFARGNRSQLSPAPRLAARDGVVVDQQRF